MTIPRRLSAIALALTSTAALAQQWSERKLVAELTGPEVTVQVEYSCGTGNRDSDHAVQWRIHNNSLLALYDVVLAERSHCCSV